MNLNRNQKLSLFVFGCPDKTKNVRDLMFAGTMAGDTPLRRRLWELAYRIREDSAGAEDFDEIFCTVREELELMAQGFADLKFPEFLQALSSRQ